MEEKKTRLYQTREQELIDHLQKENIRLLELLSNMKKDGFTYDQLTRKMIVCEACGKDLM